MRLSGLAVAVVFLLSSVVFAQHSSSGGSSSGGSSGGSASSGSSHGGSSGSSGGSSYSSGGHSSSASSSRGSSSGVSRTNGGSGSYGTRGVATPTPGGIRASAASSAKNNASQEKRSIASRFFHPFRKGDRKIAQADRRRPVCKKGTCVCPGGMAAGKNGACAAPPVNVSRCESGRYWNGGGCVAFSQYRVNDCAALEMMMREQATRMSAAEDSRLSICSRSDPACGEMTTKSADEAERYKALQQRYEQCRRRQFGAGNSGYSFGRSAANPFAIN